MCIPFLFGVHALSALRPPPTYPETMAPARAPRRASCNMGPAGTCQTDQAFPTGFPRSQTDLAFPKEP
eukprot:8383312-Pyramimonas_sp.AAC.1